MFSMAMTACAAKFLTNSICLSLNGPASCLKITIEPIGSPSFNSGTFTSAFAPANLESVGADSGADNIIWNVNDRFRAHHTVQIMSRGRSYDRLQPPPLLHESRRRPVGGNDAKRLSFTQRHDAELSPAKLDRVRQHGFKHRLKVARGARNDAQHLGGCRLLLQRLGEIVRALPQFIVQAGVLWAMTAWLAYVFNASSCFADNDPGLTRTTLSAPIAVSPRISGMNVAAR
jgi:hypothetical protein